MISSGVLRRSSQPELQWHVKIKGRTGRAGRSADSRVPSDFTASAKRRRRRRQADNPGAHDEHAWTQRRGKRSVVDLTTTIMKGDGRSETLDTIRKVIDCLVNIKDETGEFLMPLEDGRIIDTKGWNDWEVSGSSYLSRSECSWWSAVDARRW